MANGQEQQSGLPTMSADMINKTDQLLAEKRALAGQYQQQPQQQPQQQQQQTQQPTVYENFMSMNPAQLRDFQGNLHRLKQKNEVLINSGDAKLEQYESEIESGNMTWNQAIAISKNDLSPASRSLDNIYYNKNSKGGSTVTSASLSQWYEANKNKIGFGEAEQRRYDTRITAVLSKENARDVQLGKISAEEAKNVTMLRNYNNDMRTVFNSIDNAIKPLYQQDKYGRLLYFTDPTTKTQSKIIGKIEKKEKIVGKDNVPTYKPTKETAISDEDNKVLSNAINVVKEEMNRDLGITFVDGKQTGSPETRGTGNEELINENINIIANLVPLSFLKEKKGFYIGVNDAFISIPYKTGDELSFRRKFAKEIRNKYLKAKNHISGLSQSQQPQQTEPQQQQQSQPEIPTISSAADFEQLPSGTVFIDPEGKKRTKP
tara:strand:+ start:814 stop:2109 length:1296 start_codon:yes stop_codon:yes gene_type:complete